MNMRWSDRVSGVGCRVSGWLAALALGCAASAGAAETRPPNVVIVFCDDLGYADVGCFGAEGIATPAIDRLAREGMKLTSFYVAQAVCSASRAALMTGSLPNRIGILGALGPQSRHGLSSNEVTIAELLQSRGYTCGIFGKWHLGHHPEFLPRRHGFDEYLGLPYSNDMWPFHHDMAARPHYPPLRLIDGEATATIITNLEDQATLTGRYTERAVAFIEKNRERPFFLYVPHSMPHVPIAASPAFRGKSPRGLFGDVIQELDASVGSILAALDRTGVASNTLVLFTSDNGPWLRFGNHAGRATPLREGKGTMFEGGCRVPCVIRWPGHIQPGRVSDAIMATVDVLPTLAEITGAALPAHRLDGVSQRALLEGEPAAAPRDFYIYYYGDELQAIRQGPWKYYFAHTCSQYIEGTAVGRDGKPGPSPARKLGPALYHLGEDINERTDRQAEQPELVARLISRARAYDEELRANRRPAGQVSSPDCPPAGGAGATPPRSARNS